MNDDPNKFDLTRALKGLGLYAEKSPTSTAIKVLYIHDGSLLMEVTPQDPVDEDDFWEIVKRHYHEKDKKPAKI